MTHQTLLVLCEMSKCVSLDWVERTGFYDKVYINFSLTKWYGGFVHQTHFVLFLETS